MSTLLLEGTLPDLADLVRTMGDSNWVFAFIMLFFILLSSLTVMNMLVGVLVEVVSVVSAVEKEQMTMQHVKDMLLGMLENTGIDEDHNMLISKLEFQHLLLNPTAARIIQDVGVDVVGLVDFLDFIFKDCEELSFPQFMDVVLQMRGGNMATVRDIVDLRKFLLEQMNEILEVMSASFRHMRVKGKDSDEAAMMLTDFDEDINRVFTRASPGTLLGTRASSDNIGARSTQRRQSQTSQSGVSEKDSNRESYRVSCSNIPLPAFPDHLWASEMRDKQGPSP